MAAKKTTAKTTAETESTPDPLSDTDTKLAEKVVEQELQIAEIIKGRETLAEMVKGLTAENTALKTELGKIKHPANTGRDNDGFAFEPAVIDGEEYERRASRLEGRAATLTAFRFTIDEEIGRLNTEARSARIEARAAGNR